MAELACNPLQLISEAADVTGMASGDVSFERVVLTRLGTQAGIFASVETPEYGLFDNFLMVVAGLVPSGTAFLRVPAMEMRFGALEVLADRCQRFGIDLARVSVEVQRPHEGPVTQRWLKALPATDITFAVDAWRSPLELMHAFPVSTWLVDMAVGRDSSALQGISWINYLECLVHTAEWRGVTEVVATNVATESERAMLIDCGIEVMAGPLIGPVPLEAVRC